MAAVRSDEELLRRFVAHKFFEAAAPAAESEVASLTPFLSQSFVRSIQAETNLLAGRGDPLLWNEMLGGPAQVEALRNRIELDFHEQNPTVFHPMQPVTLYARVKNISSVTVKIFEVNLENYYRATPQPVSTDINLDGLVANVQRTIKYTTPNIQRHLEAFELDELSPSPDAPAGRRGVYVVELLGGGLRARALVQKGRLLADERISMAGHCLRIVDEDEQAVPDAHVWMGGKRYYADAESGEVCLPFSTQPSASSATVLLCAGDFVSLHTFQHRPEEYSLECGIHVDRESLLSGNRDCKLLLRPVLSLHGKPVSVKLLQDTSLRLDVVDQDGVPTTTTKRNLELSDTTDHVASFSMGERCNLVQVEFTARVERLSKRGDKQNLSVSKTFTFNATDASDATEDVFLRTCPDGSYELHVLGKTGEPRAARHVQLQLFHSLLTGSQPIYASLQTSPEGVVSLGALAGVERLSASLPNAAASCQRSWTLAAPSLCRRPEVIHARLGETVAVPFDFSVASSASSRGFAAPLLSLVRSSSSSSGGGAAAGSLADRVALFQTINNHQVFVESFLSHVSGDSDRGYLLLKNLPAGDYLLVLRDNSQDGSPGPVGVSSTTIRVTRVATKANPGRNHQHPMRLSSNPYVDRGRHMVWACDACSGSQGYGLVYHCPQTEPKCDFDLCASCYTKSSPERRLEMTPKAPLQIAAVTQPAADKLKIRVSAASDSTRVHLFFQRFLSDVPDSSPEATLDAAPLPSLGLRHAPPPVSRYLPASKLSEEHRYILMRQEAEATAGNMLPRPSLLLNPVELRETATDIRRAADGDRLRAMCDESASNMAYGRAAARAAAGYSETPCSNLDFLQVPVQMLPNLVPQPEQGDAGAAGEGGALAGASIEVSLSQLGPAIKDGGCLTVVAVDNGGDFVLRRLAVSGQATPKAPFVPASRDLTLKQPLDVKKSFAERREIVALGPGATWTVADTGSTTFACFDSLDKAYHLFTTLVADRGEWAGFEFLARWPRLDPAEQRRHYGEHACHEVNFFLFCHDRAFFDAVVRPYLVNKKEKGLVDRWFLGDPLDEFLMPSEFAKLNAFEQILLTQVAAGDGAGSAGGRLEAQGVRQFFKDCVNKRPLPQERYNSLFDTALKAGLVDTEPDAPPEPQPEPMMDMMAGPPPPPMAMAAMAMPMAAPAFAQASMAPGRGGGEMMMKRSAKAAPRRMRRMVREEEEACEEACDFDDEGDMDGMGGAMFGGGGGPSLDADLRRRDAARNEQLYQAPTKVKELAERQYWPVASASLTSPQSGLVPINAFWLDLASFVATHGPGTLASSKMRAFISQHLAEAASTVTSALLALACTGFAFEEQAQMVYKDGGLSARASAQHPVLVYARQIQPVEQAEAPSILVFQNFFDSKDPYYRTESGEQRDKFVTEEFRTGHPYGSRVVLTNASSAPRKVNVLMQIPQGAIALCKGSSTRSQYKHIPPYTTQVMEFFFYFARTGTFRNFPVNVAGEDNTVVGWAAPTTFRVVETLSKVDLTSWLHVANDAEDKVVLKFLEEENLATIDLGQIAWRMKDKAFFAETLARLRSRHYFHERLWRYAFVHHDQEAVREYLYRPETRSLFGPALECSLLSVPLQHTYQHTEFAPVINARLMQLGGKREILNEGMRKQYNTLLELMAWVAPGSNLGLELAAVYHLLLQDRVTEAMALFARLEDELGGGEDEGASAGAKRPVTRQSLRKQAGGGAGRVSAAVAPGELALQFDYLRAYLDFFKGAELAVAREVAQKYVDYPVARWQKLFAEVRAHIAEIDTGAVAESPLGGGAAKSTSLTLALKDKTIEIRTENLGGQPCAVRFFPMDVELLFSTKPFVEKSSKQFALIKASQTLELVLPASDGPQSSLSVPVPPAFHNANVVIEAAAGGHSESSVLYANSLNVQVLESIGQVKVTHAETGKPVPACYVKVYSRTAQSGGVEQFFRDGRTDLRGRFDYAATNNAEELNRTERFAILVCSDEHGSVVCEAAPPRR